ncbi:hypothetical protein G3435_19665 [Pseudomonas sp. MAFF212428]|uniref:Uncharacterized protein n=1 Tax=Pseudomonas brassicae TaxID=2708063 RepID=A0A6B3NKP9_9PSED|nr:hypothetical protein [Pseudomonas brassicae]NER61567.1 hypothetical protein [Pseudomonas brassicae]NER63815.1 hypothetical protein [Pseudomonas brassicae]
MDLELKNYLAGLADSNLFGSLAILCLLALLLNLSEPRRNTLWVRVLTLACLLGVVLLHGVGTYYMNIQVP